MKKLLLFVAFVGSGFLLWGQAPDKQQVERAYESFQKNFRSGQQPDQPSNRFRGSVVPLQPMVSLPAWFFTPAAASQYIGISDALPDSTTAHQQAIMRALAVAAFANGCTVKNISDNYYIDHGGRKTLGKFNSFTSLTSRGELNYEVLQTFISANGEAIVLLQVSYNDTGTTPIESHLELFQSETDDNLLTRLTFDISTDTMQKLPAQASWLLKENDTRSDISSILDNVPQVLPMARYRYCSDIQLPEPTADEYTFDLTNGLWYGYINALAVNLEQMQVFSSQVKYLDEDSNNQFQNLTRIVYHEKIAFDLHGVTISNNHLSLILEKTNASASF
ncbi:MAG TPA: hypothetical protein VFC92_10750 [Bacteroidales bacterium]|nr:hypothetical protein [Bacteroidales bacterium]